MAKGVQKERAGKRVRHAAALDQLVHLKGPKGRQLTVSTGCYAPGIAGKAETRRVLPHQHGSYPLAALRSWFVLRRIRAGVSGPQGGRLRYWLDGLEASLSGSVS